MKHLEIYKILQEDLINGILRLASNTRGKKLLIPGTPWVEYCSMDNGWCNDCLAAIHADGEAYFVEEGSEFSKKYDFEEDEDCIMVAYMVIGDIMLKDLADIAASYGICNTAVTMTRKFIEEVEEKLETLPDKFTAILPVDISVANEEMFWREVTIKEISRKGVKDPFGNIFEWEGHVALDDICIVLDHLNM